MESLLLEDGSWVLSRTPLQVSIQLDLTIGQLVRGHLRITSSSGSFPCYRVNVSTETETQRETSVTAADLSKGKSFVIPCRGVGLAFRISSSPRLKSTPIRLPRSLLELGCCRTDVAWCVVTRKIVNDRRRQIGQGL